MDKEPRFSCLHFFFKSRFYVNKSQTDNISSEVIAKLMENAVKRAQMFIKDDFAPPCMYKSNGVVGRSPLHTISHSTTYNI